MKLTLSVLPGRLAICRLAPDEALPEWALAGQGFVSLSRTPEELSVVCPEALVPEGVRSERGWRTFRVEGPLDFTLTGILTYLLQPLAQQQISIFAVSTFDTDYILVKEEKLPEAIQALKKICDVREIPNIF
jgi:hypothetical protein